MAVYQLERDMPAAEYAKWKAFYELEPFGPLIENYRSAVLSLVCANIMRSKKAKRLRLEDFLMGEGEKTVKEKQSPDQMMQTLVAFAKKQNKAIELKEKQGSKKKVKTRKQKGRKGN